MGEGFGCIYQVNKGGKLIVAKSEKKIEKKKLSLTSKIFIGLIAGDRKSTRLNSSH